MQSLLTDSEASEVLSILKGSLDKNFESVTLSFGLLFRGEIDRFKACCGLVLALLEETFLDPRQRLFALYALLELHRDRAPNLHPFWEFLLACGSAAQTAPEEVELIHLFIVQNRGTELLRRNLNDYLTSVYAMPPSVLQSHAADLHQLQKRVVVRDRGIGAMGQSGLHRVLMERLDERLPSIPREQQNEVFETFARKLTLSGFEPIYARPVPPVVTSFDSECQWRQPRIQPELMWDCGRRDPSEAALQRLKIMLEEAILTPLTPPQQKQVPEHHGSWMQNFPCADVARHQRGSKNRFSL